MPRRTRSIASGGEELVVIEDIPLPSSIRITVEEVAVLEKLDSRPGTEVLEDHHSARMVLACPHETGAPCVAEVSRIPATLSPAYRRHGYGRHHYE